MAVFCAGAVLTAALFRPRLASPHRAVDLGLLACLAFAAAQLIPLPPAIRLALSPASAGVDRALLLAPPPSTASAWHALTLDPEASLWAVGLAASVLLVFWSARATFEERRGLRLTIRGIAWFGLVLAIVTFVQRAMAPHLFYGIWRPVARTNVPTPLGPFLNRNDLATWLILAVPLEAGYVMARATALGRSSSGFIAHRVDEIFDSRMMVLIAALCLMIGLLLASASRSGIVGCGVGLLVLLTLGRQRVSTGQFLALLAGLILIGAAATAYVNLSMLTARFNDVFAADLGRGRIVIWRETWPMARDFWRTGLGVGAFERGMIVYEPRPFDLFINQAHDEYLQVLVEGGVPLMALAAFTILAGCVEAGRRLRDDVTASGWMRAGALGGMASVAVQSIWDTGLRMPANAVLFAVLAAIALHGGSAASHVRDRRA